MHAGGLGGGGFVQSDVAIQADAQEAKVDRTVARQPTPHPRALARRVRSVTLKGSKAFAGHIEWSHELSTDLCPARRGVVGAQAAPFVDLHDPEPAKQVGVLAMP